MIRYLTAGESHGEALVGIVEGMPADVPVSSEEIDRELARRWLGFGRGGRSKFEQDHAHIYSGVRFGKTLGTPIALRIDNAAYHKDKSDWPRVMSVAPAGDEVERVTLPRPGHADLAGYQKYGYDDIRPVIERASARETAMRVACCSVARAFLQSLGVRVVSHVVQLGSVTVEDSRDWTKRYATITARGANHVRDIADASPLRMLDESAADAAVEAIKECKKAGDSLGGKYEVIVFGVPAGLGSYVQWDRRLDGQLAQAILSIQGQKGVEVGSGVRSAGKPGSQVHDPIAQTEAGYTRTSNNAGGIEGGVSNGMPIVVRGYMKPIPTLIKPLQTVDVETGESQPTRYERSDVTSVPSASVVAESTVALVVANAVLEKYGGDSLSEILARFPSKLSD